MINIESKLRPPVAVLECAAPDRTDNAGNALEEADEAADIVLTRHVAR